MDNEKRLREQLSRVGLAPLAVLHERGCNAPCRCDVRGIVSVKVRANTRLGYKTVRHVVRVDKSRPDPEPFRMPEPEIPEAPIPLVPHPLISAQPEPPKKRRRGRPRKQR